MPKITVGTEDVWSRALCNRQQFGDVKEKRLVLGHFVRRLALCWPLPEQQRCRANTG